MEPGRHTLRLSPRNKPVRLDRALAEELDSVSRTLTQRWIQEGRVLLNGRPAKPAALVQGGEEIVLDLPPPEPIDLLAEDLPLPILFEDDLLAIVDKPAGMSTHPAGPIRQGTLVNALLHHVRTLSHLGGELRPGIVHRLDKGTSGLLVIAKTDDAHRRLAKDLAQRKISRIY
ncbi:MAG TPA: RluA family pseudouridine synthase, partial [bacterium]|nr:RluA family pseudouridine synthase [bacterium]